MASGYVLDGNGGDPTTPPLIQFPAKTTATANQRWFVRNIDGKNIFTLTNCQNSLSIVANENGKLSFDTTLNRFDQMFWLKMVTGVPDMYQMLPFKHVDESNEALTHYVGVRSGEVVGAEVTHYEDTSENCGTVWQFIPVYGACAALIDLSGA